MNRLLVLMCLLCSRAPLAAQTEEPTPPKKPAVKLDAFGDPLTDDASDALTLDRSREKELVAALYAAHEDFPAAFRAVESLPAKPTELQLRALRNLDRQFGKSAQAEHRKLVALGIEKMAFGGDETTLQYLHKVFDSQPERRAAIATAVAKWAIAEKRRPHDWPMLIRSLTALEGEQTLTVCDALLLYRERARNPSVIRNLILAGISLREPHELPWKLLEHWTGERLVPLDNLAAQPAAWQGWFKKNHPLLMEATLPVADPMSRYAPSELSAITSPDKLSAGDAAKGAIVFEKGLCVKCHRFGERGERVGPDLSRVTERLTNRELVESLLFPNHQISDQYATKNLLLKDGKTLAGIVGKNGDSLIVLPATGVKTIVAKSEIESISESPLSAMPSGLLNALGPQEIVDLFAYLHAVPDR